MRRRRFVRITASAGVAAVAGILPGCSKKAEPKPDPTYDAALPTMEDVDDSLAAHVEGDRVRVVYKPDGAIKGAAEPLVTLVEFSDFQCPFCGSFAQVLDELLLAYPNDLRVVFMQFPLPMHQNAELAAKAAVAAQAQGRFWAMHDEMFANRTRLDRAGLDALAAELGLEPARFAADLEAKATVDRVAWEIAIGGRLGVRGTPSCFVNCRALTGAPEPAALRDLIEEERALAQRLIAAGSPRNAVYAHINRAARPAGAFRGAAAEPRPPR
jgi:protein-disulfide isomerase